MATPASDASYISKAKTWATSFVPESVKNIEYKKKFADLTDKVNNSAPLLAIAAIATVLYFQPTSSFNKYVAGSFVATLLVPEIMNRVVNQVKELYKKTHIIELALIVAVAGVLIEPVLYPKAAALALGGYAAKGVALTLGAWASKSIQDRADKDVKSV